MKRLVMVVLLLGSLVLSSCSPPPPVTGGVLPYAGIRPPATASDVEGRRKPNWYMLQSPLTGRYYEVIHYFPNSTFSAMAMSEVTKAEYDEYLSQIK